MDQVRALTLASTRRRDGGVSVLELVVACLVLGLLSAMIFLTLQTSRTAQQKLDAADTMQRAHLIARLHLADLLRGARMATPNAGAPISATLSFQRPLVIDGELQVDVLGNQLWSDFVEVRMDAQGHLIATSPQGPQVLAYLGPGSTFQAEARDHKVHVTLRSAAYKGHPERTSQADYYIGTEVIPGGP